MHNIFKLHVDQSSIWLALAIRIDCKGFKCQKYLSEASWHLPDSNEKNTEMPPGCGNTVPLQVSFDILE